MKHLLKVLCLAVMSMPLMVACGGDDESSSENTPSTSKTTYNFKYSAEDYASYGLVLDVTIFEYSSSNEKIAQQTIRNCKKGHSSTYTAHTKAEKVKVYCEASHPQADESMYFWVAQVYYLDKGKNTTIHVTETDRVSEVEP